LRKLLAVLSAAILLLVPGSTGVAMAATNAGEAQAKPETCRSAEKAIVYYRSKVWKYQTQLGEAPSPTYYPERKKNACAYKRWVAKNWQGIAREYRKEIKERFTLRDFRAVPENHAWHQAVDEAQKAYPGTKDWLLSCSATEGGWGRWVPNSDGYPPGGWMQMYHSTWSTMWYGWYGNAGAFKHLLMRGFRIPQSAHSWYSPLGQALASAHGKLNGRGGEWHGSGC